MYGDLSGIAPTIMLNSWPYEGNMKMLQAVEQNILTISNIMGRSEDGQAFLDSFHTRIQEYKNRVDTAGLTGSKFILANPVALESEPALFLFVPNSQNSEILERMGLKNAVSSPEELARYGHTEVSLEALAALGGPDVHFYLRDYCWRRRPRERCSILEEPFSMERAFIRLGRQGPSHRADKHVPRADRAAKGCRWKPLRC